MSLHAQTATARERADAAAQRARFSLAVVRTAEKLQGGIHEEYQVDLSGEVAELRDWVAQAEEAASRASGTGSPPQAAVAAKDAEEAADEAAKLAAVIEASAQEAYVCAATGTRHDRYLFDRLLGLSGRGGHVEYSKAMLASSLRTEALLERVIELLTPSADEG